MASKKEEMNYNHTDHNENGNTSSINNGSINNKVIPIETIIQNISNPLPIIQYEQQQRKQQQHNLSELSYHPWNFYQSSDNNTSTTAISSSSSNTTKNNNYPKWDYKILKRIQNNNFITATIKLSISYITRKNKQQNYTKAKECLDEILNFNNNHIFTLFFYGVLYVNQDECNNNRLLLRQSKLYWKRVIDLSSTCNGNCDYEIQYLFMFLDSKDKKYVDCSMLLNYDNYNDDTASIIISNFINYLKQRHQKLANAANTAAVTNTTTTTKKAKSAIDDALMEQAMLMNDSDNNGSKNGKNRTNFDKKEKNYEKRKRKRKKDRRRRKSRHDSDSDSDNGGDDDGEKSSKNRRKRKRKRHHRRKRRHSSSSSSSSDRNDDSKIANTDDDKMLNTNKKIRNNKTRDEALDGAKL